MKTIVSREPEACDIYIHTHGHFVDVQFAKQAPVRATVRSSPMAKSFVAKLVFWSRLELRWNLQQLLQFVAEEHENAVYAARRRCRRRIFSS